MAMEFFMVHGISERKNIILRKLRSRILKYILPRYINSNIFTKKENDFKVLWPQNSNKHCNTAKEPNNLASAVYKEVMLYLQGLMSYCCGWGRWCYCYC